MDGLEQAGTFAIWGAILYVACLAIAVTVRENLPAIIRALWR